MANNQLLASDNFASGSLAAGWALMASATGLCQIVAGSPNVAEPSALTNTYGQVWTASGILKNQISEVVLAATPGSGSFVLVRVRWQVAANSGYDLEISAGAATLFRWDSGVATQLATQLLTISAGDVFDLVADGGALVAYQNYVRIFYVADAVYASGYSGFGQTSSVSVTTNKVSSWSGYSLIQQDGIWQKQGVIVPGIASDFATGGAGTFNGSQILFEGNAQILSGNVYKMWFGVGPFTTSGSIAYAESTDGINWTRRGTNVISGFLNPSVIKNGSTYFLYAQSGSSTPFAVYTSTDGVNWTQQSSTVLSRGAGGSWDAFSLYYFVPVQILNGTWSALYGASNASGVWSVGLATSSDGIVWTKYVNNPVIAGSNALSGKQVFTSPAISNVSGTWYMWGASYLQAADPTDTILWSSPDLINWTFKGLALHHSQFSESVNASDGQTVPMAVRDINGRAYLYSTSATHDGLAPELYQISLAIAPSTIANIVTKSEDATTPIAADAFQGALGNLSSNWVNQGNSTKLQIVSGNVVQASAINTVCQMCYTGAVFSNDQYADITIATLSSVGAFAWPAVRCSTVTDTAYEISLNGAAGGNVNGACILKRVNGSNTVIGPQLTIPLAVGDTIRLSAVGNVISFYRNGFLVIQVQDNTISSGVPGMGIFTPTLAVAQISSWAGGNANVIPNYPTGSFAAQPIASFATNTGPGSNNPVLLFSAGLGIEAHVIPSASDPNAPIQTIIFPGINPVSPATSSTLNQYARPTTKEAVTSTGIQFRNPA